MVLFTVAADGFLYNMVRIMVGTLLRVQQGKLAPEDIPGVLAAQDRRRPGPPPPPGGCTSTGCFTEQGPACQAREGREAMAKHSEKRNRRKIIQLKDHQPESLREEETPEEAPKAP